jgi:hypothetical protein
MSDTPKDPIAIRAAVRFVDAAERAVIAARELEAARDALLRCRKLPPLRVVKEESEAEGA